MANSVDPDQTPNSAVSVPGLQCKGLSVPVLRVITVSSEFVCFEVLRPSQASGVMLSTVSLLNHKFTGQV